MHMVRCPQPSLAASGEDTASWAGFHLQSWVSCGRAPRGDGRGCLLPPWETAASSCLYFLLLF